VRAVVHVICSGSGVQEILYRTSRCRGLGRKVALYVETGQGRGDNGRVGSAWVQLRIGWVVFVPFSGLLGALGLC